MKDAYDGSVLAHGPIYGPIHGPVLDASPGALLGRASFALARAFDRLYLWQLRHAGRRHLEGLDERLLRDIGLSRVDALREASKPFWRP